LFSHRFAVARKQIDGVHPTAAGHGLIADAWLKAVGAWSTSRKYASTDARHGTPFRRHGNHAAGG